MEMQHHKTIEDELIKSHICSTGARLQQAVMEYLKKTWGQERKYKTAIHFMPL